MEFNRFNSWKILRYSDKLQKIANMDDGSYDYPYPLVFHVYPSNICPMDCYFCIMQQEKKSYQVMLSKDILHKMIIDVKRLGVELVHFSGGGEPFTNPYVFDIIKDNNCYDGYKIAVSTNGVLFEPELIKNINHLRISVNAFSESTYMQIMKAPKNYLKKVHDKIIDTVKIRNRIKDDTYHDIGLGFLILPENWTELYKFVEYAVYLGVDFVHIRPAYFPFVDGKNIELMDIVVNHMDMLRDMIVKDFSNDIDIGIVTEKFEGYWSRKNYSKCRSTPLQVVLTASGEFIVCQDVFIRFGNYYNQSFEEIWRSREHKNAIDKICLDDCPRCVETRHNQIIEHFFLNNDVRSELL